MKRLLSKCLTGAVLMSCWAAAALAAPDATGAGSEASAHFSRGVELFREGNLDAALAEFRRANEIAPDYRLLYNMAQVQAERHDYVQAIDLLEHYLRQGGARITAARRAEVEQEDAKLRERVGALWVASTPTGATLYVNGEKAATLPLEEPVLLNPGVSKLRVEAEGYKTYTSDLNVAGGDRPRLSIALEVMPVSSNVVAASAEPVIDYTPVWISGVAAGALTIGAVTFGVLTSSAASNLDKELDTFPGNPSKLDSASTNVTTFAGLTDAFAVGALLAAGVGVYFLAFPMYDGSGNEERTEPGPQLNVSAGLGGLAIDGRF